MEPGSVRESICSSTLRKGQSTTRCHGSCVGRFSVIPAHESLGFYWFKHFQGIDDIASSGKAET